MVGGPLARPRGAAGAPTQKREAVTREAALGQPRRMFQKPWLAQKQRLSGHNRKTVVAEPLAPGTR